MNNVWINLGNTSFNNEFLGYGELSDTSKQILRIAEKVGVSTDSGNIQILDILEAIVNMIKDEDDE